MRRLTLQIRFELGPQVLGAEFTWHPRGWLLTRTVKGATTPEDAMTTYTYDATGQVTRTTQPDGDYLDYEYDDAHRLTAIEDALGDRIDYTLDAAGNRTAESTKDTNDTVKRSLSRIYDQLGRRDLAQFYYRRSLECNPGFTPARQKLSMVD